MTAFWTEPDFDEHEMVQFVEERIELLRAGAESPFVSV